MASMVATVIRADNMSATTADEVRQVARLVGVELIASYPPHPIDAPEGVWMLEVSTVVAHILIQDGELDRRLGKARIYAEMH